MAGSPFDLSSPEPWATDAIDVSARLEVDAAAGLDPDDAVRRGAVVGANELEPAKGPTVLGLVWEGLTEPFVLLLLGAGVGAILLGEARDGLLVLAGLVPIVVAGVVTEYRAERALEALRTASAPTARVRRGGRPSDVPAAELVPGDIVLVRGGDVVPADLRISRAERLLIDRSVLTGESVPEVGRSEADPPGAPLVDRRSMAYAGTSVVGGRGEGIVTAIGHHTEVGRIALGLREAERHRSPLQLELDRLVRILLVVAIGLIAITTGLGFARGNPAGENFLAGISAAIAAIPEEPPVLLAVILGLGAYRLLRRGVLVRRLNAEETLGAVDLILTDKTGTLTQNRLEVRSVRTLDGPVTGDADRRPLLLAALRAEDDAWVRDEGVPAGSFTRSLEAAVLAAGGDAALTRADLLEGEPFDDGRPYSRTRSRTLDGGCREDAIGAPEAILSMLAASDSLDAAEADGWRSLVEASASDGERLVASAGREDGDRWQMRALVGFADPPRNGLGDALDRVTAAGIQTIVVTGDHPVTAAALARGIGLPADHIVTGDQLATWDDERLRAELGTLHIVARSTPDQKERLVRIARAAGRRVAVTGDGVNDAPALHRADIAVAMGSGTAVAKEAADLVLGDDSFVTLVDGLAEGRRIVDNVQKGLVFLVSTHVALLGFLLIATLVGFGQPLLPLQILWLELFIDTSTSVAFEREAAEPDLMRRPPRRVGVPLLTDRILARIAVAGGFSAVAALALMLWHDSGPEHARWLAYTSLVCAQVVRAYANRSLTQPIHRLPANAFLLAAAVLVIAIQAAIPHAPLLAEAFHATPLDATDWLLVTAIALAPAIVAEVVKTIRPREWVA